jgi:hypothetical protein
MPRLLQAAVAGEQELPEVVDLDDDLVQVSICLACCLPAPYHAELGDTTRCRDLARSWQHHRKDRGCTSP